MTRGLEIRVLDDTNTWSLIGSGYEFSVRSTQFFHGWDYTWDLSLGQSMGNFDGETFWVGCGWFRDRGGERKGQDTFRRVVFHCTRRVYKHPHFLCYILYIEEWGFHFIILQTITNGVPDPQCPGQSHGHVRCCGFDNLTTSSTLNPHTEDNVRT